MQPLRNNEKCYSNVQRPTLQEVQEINVLLSNWHNHKYISVHKKTILRSNKKHLLKHYRRYLSLYIALMYHFVTDDQRETNKNSWGQGRIFGEWLTDFQLKSHLLRPLYRLTRCLQGVSFVKRGPLSKNKCYVAQLGNFGWFEGAVIIISPFCCSNW